MTVNKVILVGNLGQDPEIRHSKNGEPIANLSIATSETWLNKETNNREKKTEWHRVVFFGKMATTIQTYLRKGSKVYIEGSLKTRKWQDKEGNDRYSTDVNGREIRFLDKKESTDNPGDGTPGNYKKVQDGDFKQPISNPPPKGFDDDIPF